MFRLLVVALLLPAALCDVMRGVQILNHRAMCTKADGTRIPLAATGIHFTEGTKPQKELKEWVTDAEGYVRDYAMEVSGHAYYNGHTHLAYYIECAKYGPLCPGVAITCKNTEKLYHASDKYVVLPCVWELKNPAHAWEKVLNGGLQSIALDSAGEDYTIQMDKIPPAPPSAMKTSGNLDRQISILNHRAYCKNNEGTRVPLVYQYVYLHEDTEQLFWWMTNGDGYIRNHTSVHHNRAKWMGKDSKTRILYYANCATYGPICPGVAEQCTDSGSKDVSQLYAVVSFIWELPNPDQKYLNGGWGSIDWPHANGKANMVMDWQAKPKRSERAARKMLQQ